MEIDLNCDLGEGCGLDAELMPVITSANVSCGLHAGSATTAFDALDLAVRHGVQVGAHPGYDDRLNFGRRELALTQAEVLHLCMHQVGALAALARLTGQPLKYVKPHGALYNQACRDPAYAEPVVAAAAAFGLAVMGLPASRLATACDGQCRFVAEGFADRRYLPDGSLVPRSRSDAFIDDADEAVRQATWLSRERGVQSLCVHGDNPSALVFVKALREALLHQGFIIKAFV